MFHFGFRNKAQIDIQIDQKLENEEIDLELELIIFEVNEGSN